jgi:hypothetical protein
MEKAKILFLVLFASLSSYAQDPQLFENTWYLQKVIIDGQDNFPPINNEVPYIPLLITINNLETNICDSMSGSFVEINNDSFTVSDFNFLLIECSLQENIDFETLYFIDFFNALLQDKIYNYTIESNTGNSKILTLTNDSGNQAIYGNEILSNQGFDISSFKVYPNPVKDKLFIFSKPSINDFDIFIYSIDGKLILSLNDLELNNNSIDVQKLNSGIYFMRIEDNLGRNAIKKFIKN